MQLFQLVLRCVTGPFKAAVHRPAYHHVVHHIGHLGRLPIRRIAAYTPSGFGLACRYVAIAIGIGGVALIPPVAMLRPFVPPIPSPPSDGSGAGDYRWPGGGPGIFGPQDAPRQALLVAPVGGPFEFTIDTLTTSNDLSLEYTLPIFPGINTPSGVTSVPTTTQDVPEPPSFVLLLTSVLALAARRLWCKTESVALTP
jgi:hypothetical protein